MGRVKAGGASGVASEANTGGAVVTDGAVAGGGLAGRALADVGGTEAKLVACGEDDMNGSGASAPPPGTRGSGADGGETGVALPGGSLTGGLPLPLEDGVGGWASGTLGGEARPTGGSGGGTEPAALPRGGFEDGPPLIPLGDWGGLRGTGKLGGGAAIGDIRDFFD